ncbi:hypothetical protein ACHAW5_010192 [Stephanodiscus triporus]|uniref:Uncharacterized protein n=1 Tax=Stephanodiscus triporus TaxID=2934178 RepID=A0ABD3PNN6_9STRA
MLSSFFSAEQSLAMATAPLAWTGCDASGADEDEIQAELKRFTAAAQLEVAGLAADEILVDVTVHPDLLSFVKSKTSLEVKADGSVVVVAHAFVEPEWGHCELPGMYTLVHENKQDGHGSSAALVDLLLPTLCLKLKRREMIACALGGTVCDESTVDQPDRQAAMRVNLLAWRWASERAGAREMSDTNQLVQLELTDDTELLDDPAKPLGNRGGLFIESRIRLEEVADVEKGEAPVVRVTSPTIITPLWGVPRPVLACHYMKVLYPLSKVFSRAWVLGQAQTRPRNSRAGQGNNME